MPALRRTVKTAVLTAAAVLAALALLELGIRLLLPRFDPSGQVAFARLAPDAPPLGAPGAALRQSKNTGDYDVAVRFNRHGLRDPKDLADARAGAWFLVGDSFAFGWGVEEEERFGNRLERRLGAPVYNVAAPGNLDGYGQLIDYALGRGAAIERLLVAVCMENDLARYAPAAQGGGASGEARHPVAPPPRLWRHALPGMARVKDWLSEHSASYRAATTVVQQTPALYDAAVGLGLLRPNLDGIPPPRQTRETVAASVARALALADGYRTTFVIISSRALWTGRERRAADRVHRAFVEGLRGAGADVVDLRPVFEATGNPLGLHFANDGHWNPDGHRVAAEALAAHIGEKG